MNENTDQPDHSDQQVGLGPSAYLAELLRINWAVDRHRSRSPVEWTELARPEVFN